ncbi:hypothetical protein CR970_02170 [Candidatus Saccharibacteria bacterium]|nr:MAG: hypothetical protein CR970_02170 [Candidatus Saccharibacteria bacterium]
MFGVLEPVLTDAPQRVFKTKTIIMHQGEAKLNAYAVIRGLVKVYTISAQGNEQVVTFHGPGDVFPSSWIFDTAPGALFFYQTCLETEVYCLDRETFLQKVYESPQRTQALLDHFARRYTADTVRINALQQPRAREKLLYTLFYLCQRYNTSGSPNLEIPFPLTQQLLGGLVGLTRETTATELNKLRRLGVITYDKQHYGINAKKLIAAMGSGDYDNLCSIRHQT